MVATDDDDRPLEGRWIDSLPSGRQRAVQPPTVRFRGGIVVRDEKRVRQLNARLGAFEAAKAELASVPAQQRHAEFPTEYVLAIGKGRHGEARTRLSPLNDERRTLGNLRINALGSCGPGEAELDD